MEVFVAHRAGQYSPVAVAVTDTEAWYHYLVLVKQYRVRAVVCHVGISYLDGCGISECLTHKPNPLEIAVQRKVGRSGALHFFHHIAQERLYQR